MIYMFCKVIYKIDSLMLNNYLIDDEILVHNGGFYK